MFEVINICIYKLLVYRILALIFKLDHWLNYMNRSCRIIKSWISGVREILVPSEVNGKWKLRVYDAKFEWHTLLKYEEIVWRFWDPRCGLVPDALNGFSSRNCWLFSRNMTYWRQKWEKETTHNLPNDGGKGFGGDSRKTKITTKSRKLWIANVLKEHSS